MTFGFVWALLLLGALPGVVFLRQQQWGRPSSVLYPETRSVRDVFRGGRRPGSGLGEALRLAAIALLIVAAARPQWIQSVQHQTTSGLDMILALDISGSMSARDFAPRNRLQAAKDELRAFLARERNNRLGLIAFAAQAFTVCPLTLDYHVLALLLDHLQIGMTADGTAIGMAIATGSNRLKDSEARTKVIVLLTDGRNNAGRIEPLTAAEMAAALGIRIYTIGMGQPGGAPILVKNAAGVESVLLDDDGSVHLEEVDEKALQQIADLTGGQYFRATDKNKLKAIYTEIRKLEQSRLTAKKYTTRKDIGHFFILLALLVFFAELAVSRFLEPRIP